MEKRPELAQVTSQPSWPLHICSLLWCWKGFQQSQAEFYKSSVPSPTFQMASPNSSNPSCQTALLATKLTPAYQKNSSFQQEPKEASPHPLHFVRKSSADHTAKKSRVQSQKFVGIIWSLWVQSQPNVSFWVQCPNFSSTTYNDLTIRMTCACCVHFQFYYKFGIRLSDTAHCTISVLHKAVSWSFYCWWSMARVVGEVFGAGGYRYFIIRWTHNCVVRAPDAATTNPFPDTARTECGRMVTK